MILFEDQRYSEATPPPFVFSSMVGADVAMAAHSSELELAKKNLTDAIGDNIKQSAFYFIFTFKIINKIKCFLNACERSACFSERGVGELLASGITCLAKLAS